VVHERVHDDDIYASLYILLGASKAVRVKPRFPREDRSKFGATTLA